MRIDKFLKVSRILKRRSVANQACAGGKVFVNNKEVKPSYKLKEADVVQINFANGKIKFIVKSLKEVVKKEDASLLYEIVESDLWKQP